MINETCRFLLKIKLFCQPLSVYPVYIEMTCAIYYSPSPQYCPKDLYAQYEDFIGHRPLICLIPSKNSIAQGITSIPPTESGAAMTKAKNDTD